MWENLGKMYTAWFHRLGFGDRRLIVKEGPGGILVELQWYVKAKGLPVNVEAGYISTSISMELIECSHDARWAGDKIAEEMREKMRAKFKAEGLPDPLIGVSR